MKGEIRYRREKAPLYPYDPAVTESAILVKGAARWLEPYGYRVPAGSLRIREDDAMPPEAVARINRQYRDRYLAAHGRSGTHARTAWHSDGRRRAEGKQFVSFITASSLL